MQSLQLRLWHHRLSYNTKWVKEAACCLHFLQVSGAWLSHGSNSSVMLECWPETSSWKSVSVNLLCASTPLNCAKAADAPAPLGLTPGVQQDGDSQQQRCCGCAQHSLHGTLLRMQARISHPSAQLHTASGTSFSSHVSCVLLGRTIHVFFFHTVCRWRKEITQPMATFRLHLIKIYHSSLSV